MIFICFAHGKNAMIPTGGHKESKGKKRNEHSPKAGRPPTIISFFDLVKVLHRKAGISSLTLCTLNAKHVFST